MKTPFRTDYTYTVEGSVIAITGLTQSHKRGINDLENVLDKIQAELGDLTAYAVIYRDTRGRWDGVRLIGDSVIVYALNEPVQQRAASRLLHLLEV